MHLHKNKVALGSLQHLGGGLCSIVDDSYSLTVAVGASVWGIVGVLFSWEGRLVLTFSIIIIFIIVIIIIVVVVNTVNTSIRNIPKDTFISSKEPIDGFIDSLNEGEESIIQDVNKALPTSLLLEREFETRDLPAINLMEILNNGQILFKTLNTVCTIR